MWMNADFTKYIGGIPSTRQQCWMRLLNFSGHWDLMGYGYWAVEEKATGLYVGCVGFSDFKRVPNDELARLPEAGWAFAPSFQKKGYCTEAMRAAMEWGSMNLRSHAVFCGIHRENIPSLKIAKGLGFEEHSRDGDAIYFNLKFHRHGG